MKKVLVVDNHEGIREVLKQILLETSYIPLLASSYEGILKVLKKSTPDVIFVDVSLENEDGRIICQKMKENEATSNIPIILFSASREKLMDFKRFKADGILEKPFDINQVIYIIEYYTAVKTSNK